jgi:preprotein translocase subunit SecA
LYDGLSAHQFATCIFISTRVREAYEIKVQCEKPEAISAIERYTILSAIDRLWQEHLYFMDSLRNSIGLRAYGQRDPLIEYKAEAFKTFEELMIAIKSEICRNIFLSASSMSAFENFFRVLAQAQAIHPEVSALGKTTQTETTASTANPDMVSEAADVATKAKPVRTGPKVGRNDPCPCRSGKKYKQCCGKNG